MRLLTTADQIFIVIAFLFCIVMAILIVGTGYRDVCKVILYV
jgi:hypothetical protein